MICVKTEFKASLWLVLGIDLKYRCCLRNAMKKVVKSKGGGHEMAAMMLMKINFINSVCALIKLIIINIIAAISWPSPLICNFFHPGFLKAIPFLCSLAVFAWLKYHDLFARFCASNDLWMFLYEFFCNTTQKYVDFILLLWNYS